MTIVVAGYDGNEVFFIADSAITANKKTLLSGFKKIYSIPIKLNKPYINRTFYHYMPYRGYEGEAAFALAGSTLIAQHIINLITEHLGKIRFIHTYTPHGIQYSLLRHCNTRDNPFYESRYIEYDDNLYLDNELYKSININDLKDVIEYSVKEALSSASQHSLNENDWKRIIDNEYLFALNCPISNKNYLYQIEINAVEEDGVLKSALPTVKPISLNKLGVIGLKDRKQDLEDFYNQLIAKKSENISLRMLGKVEEFIELYRNEGNLGVSKPVIFKTFDKKLIKRINIDRNGRWIFMTEDQTVYKIIDDKNELNLNAN
ncbi:hypothetical protein ABFO97_07600 [Acinetobacter baumannii]|uniref:hypothetical protein n=1 Tax=Acinetobacter calcoaceticus/baumannii complex TaxID=909768 RepID=UPI0004B1881C|nr:MULTISPECIES: hypothetical protein [Acinetobacter calcoaceticus/baumannii complex]EHU1484096.1 hypothetical protein [Acinetobacter baumannii]EHU2704458.1 hypothetical protein [Acinetobacter baumannii]EIB6895321.1 hypothetical protein [Acinetobacter baumannii]EIB7120741.1 hypothetical protein [Acinetobacter baumannii]EKV0482451.1 hypothetical protein [Acinetobacter baumannii]